MTVTSQIVSEDKAKNNFFIWSYKGEFRSHLFAEKDLKGQGLIKFHLAIV